ncbi:MAG: hypothetical protein GX230_09215 [Lentisphaerae bacterium]|jgi:hypothetical protein|nr:hypothetical protein [Lentisphaerota bacterium]
MKLSKAVGAMSAKVMLQGGNVTFTAKSWDANGGEAFQATMSAQSGETMVLHAIGDDIWGTISGGKAGDGLEFDGVRNRFVVRSDSEATALLNKFEGYYTMALPIADCRFYLCFACGRCRSEWFRLSDPF